MSKRRNPRYLHLIRGTFCARKIVPKELRNYVGKSSLEKDLGTNRVAAEYALPATIGEFHRTIDEARVKLKAAKLKSKDAPEQKQRSPEWLAESYFSEMLWIDELHRNEDSDYSKTIKKMSSSDEQFFLKVISGSATNQEIEKELKCFFGIYELFKYNIPVSGTPKWRALGRATAIAEIELNRILMERNIGDFSSKTTVEFLQPQRQALLMQTDQPGPTSQVTTDAPVKHVRAKPVPIYALFDDYMSELKADNRGEAAERRWRPVIKRLVDFIGHEDVSRMTKTNLIEWKDSLVRDLSNKTIADVYIVAIKAIFKWAVANGRIESSPASALKIKSVKKQYGRERGFNDEEALALLEAVSTYKPKHSQNPRTNEHEKTTSAKRWTPWLCAFTGSRIAEMTQLRKEDIQSKDGFSYMRITEDAGSVKTGGYRDVPVHPQLLELGFLDFVASSPDGPLFFANRSNPAACLKRSASLAETIAKWVRSLNVLPETVQPNHGWRHRLKTIGRDVGMQTGILDAIQGHTTTTVGDTYGDKSISTKYRELVKIPYYRSSSIPTRLFPNPKLPGNL